MAPRLSKRKEKRAPGDAGALGWHERALAGVGAPVRRGARNPEEALAVLVLSGTLLGVAVSSSAGRGSARWRPLWARAGAEEGGPSTAKLGHAFSGIVWTPAWAQLEADGSWGSREGSRSPETRVGALEEPP